MKKIIILALSFLFINTSFSQINFSTGSLSDVLKKARDEKKLLMVDVLTEWCKWCIELDNKVYANPNVYEFANANQVNYKIDAEKGEGIEFAKKYNIQGYPTILFLNGDGTEIDRIYGYYPAKDFYDMMVDYNKGINTTASLEAILEKDPDDIPANLKIADKFMSLGELDKAREHLKRIIAIDPQNLSGKTDDAKYKLASMADKDNIINDLETFIKENSQSDVLKQAYVSLAESYYSVRNDAGSAEKYFKDAMSLFPDDEMVMLSYGQFLNSRAHTLMDKGTSDEDFKNGLILIDEALTYVKGSVNEASSNYIQSGLYFRLKDYNKAMDSINRALKIFDRKLYRDFKTKIEEQLSLR